MAEHDGAIVPHKLGQPVSAIVGLTYAVCGEHVSGEHALLCRCAAWAAKHWNGDRLSRPGSRRPPLPVEALAGARRACDRRQ